MRHSKTNSTKKAAALLTLAVAMSAVVGLSLQTVVGAYDNAIAVASHKDTVEVVIATKTLYPGIVIEAADLATIEIEEQFLPDEGKGLLLRPEQVLGRTPRTRILPNEFLPEARMANSLDGTGANALVPRGMRAMSIGIGDGAALAGLLQPGSWVDVLVTIADDEGSGDVVTTTVAYGQYVLGVNGLATGPVSKRDKKRKRSKPSVTLVVEPTTAIDIAHANLEGRVTLTLINPDDPERGMVREDHFEIVEVEAPGEWVAPPPPEPDPVAPDPWLVDLCKGRNCETIEFEPEPTP